MQTVLFEDIYQGLVRIRVWRGFQTQLRSHFSKSRPLFQDARFSNIAGVSTWLLMLIEFIWKRMTSLAILNNGCSDASSLASSESGKVFLWSMFPVSSRFRFTLRPTSLSLSETLDHLYANSIWSLNDVHALKQTHMHTQTACFF